MQYRFIPASGVLVMSTPRDHSLPPVRGKCKGFSPTSQYGLRNHMDRIDSVHVPLFVSLTFARAEDYGGDVERAKAKLQNLGRVLCRKYPHIHVIWKREWQMRQQFDGVPVVHFHLGVYGLPYSPQLNQWFKQSWAKRGGGFVDVMEVSNPAAFRNYIAKFKGEFSKSRQTRDDREDGRWWGDWGKVEPYLAEVYRAAMDHARGERLMQAVDAGNRRATPRLHYYCARLQSTCALDVEAAARIMSYLAGNDAIPLEEVAGHFIWKRK